MALSDQIEAAVVQRIAGLGLTLNGTAATVEGKKLPKIERGLETTPLVVVAAGERPVRMDWLDSGGAAFHSGRKLLGYPVEVFMGGPGDRDPTVVQTAQRDWRQSIGRAFEPPSVLGLTEVLNVVVDPGPQYERTGFVRNYDASRLDLIVETIEPAGAD